MSQLQTDTTMAKGNYTQCVVVLFSDNVALHDLLSLLTEYSVVGELPEIADWEFSGPSLTVAYQPDVNGYVSVDVVNRPWPDGMGDPNDEATLFSAWSMGYFGPFTSPESLYRASQQSRLWPKAAEVATRHRAFVRVRMSYVLGASADAKMFPDNYESWPELDFVTYLAATLLSHPLALCYFNPNGEVLLDRNEIIDELTYCRGNALPALRIWTNVRMFKHSDTWLVMDSVGGAQLDILDLEAVFPTNRFDPNDVARWLRNAAVYQMQGGERVGPFQDEPVIRDGDWVDGPGEVRWQARRFRQSMAYPPRQVVRLFPEGTEAIPEEFLVEQETSV